MTAPRYAYDAAILHSLAAHLLTQRKARYPGAVTKGAMTEAQAARGILVMGEIERIHERYKLAREGAQIGTIDHETTARERRDCLDKLAGATAKIAAAAPGDTAKADYAQAVAALAWHAGHGA